MYRSFFKLKSKPFQISSDPAFLWLGEKHKEALATLRYGILDNKGFLLLTGDVGTGKTTLINTLIGSLGQDVICTSVPDPNLEKIDFYNFVARGFGLEKTVNSKGEFLAWLTRFLHTAHDAGKKVLLIIDEAQLLTQELLEEIRLLSNVELAETKLLNIFFVGQNEFNEILTKPINRAVRQRLTLNYNIEPLGLTETAGYIEYRLKVAGTDETLFTPGAVQEIYAQSQGFPRRINVLCDHALLTGYVRDKPLIDEQIIMECARELDIPLPEKHNTRAAPGPIVQPLAKPADPRSTRVSETPLGKRYWGRFPAYAILIPMGLLVLAGAMLFPEHVQTLYGRADQYLSAVKAEVAALLSDQAPSPSVNRSVSQDISQPVSQDRSQDRSQDLSQDNPSVLSGEYDPAALDGPVETFVPVDASVYGQAFDPAAQVQAGNRVETDVDSQIKTIPEPLVEQYQMPRLVETGVPVKKGVQPLEDKVIVRFGYNNNDFTDQGLEVLTRFANTLVSHPEAKVSIKGYTDAHGNKAYNLKLSEFRANIVKSFMLGRGARSDQMETLGLGSENPIATNDTTQGRMINRRVEIEVISK